MDFSTERFLWILDNPMEFPDGLLSIQYQYTVDGQVVVTVLLEGAPPMPVRLPFLTGKC